MQSYCFAQNLDSGLVGYWPFNGNAKDMSGNGNDGVVLGTPIFVNGSNGFGIKLGGFDHPDWVKIDNSSSLSFNKNFSFSGWFRIESDISMANNKLRTNYGYMVIMGKSGDQNGLSVFLYGNSTNKNWDIVVENGRTYSGKTYHEGLLGHTNIGLNDWHFFSVTVSNEEVKLYLDCKLLADTTITKFNLNPIMTTQPIFIGINQDQEWYPFNGTLDEIRVYNRVTSEQEISLLYNGIDFLNYEVTNLPSKIVLNSCQTDTLITFMINNKSNFKLPVTCNFKNGNCFTIQNNDITIDSNSINTFKIKYSSKELNHCIDTLYISMNCNLLKKYQIVSLVNIVESTISSIDTITNVGTENFHIPIKAKLNCQQILADNLSFKAKIKFNASTFLPTGLTKGQILNDSIDKDFFRSLTIQCDSVNISEKDSILTELIGTVLLGDSIIPIEITDFKWNNSSIEIDTIINGSLRTKICAFPIRRIQFFTPTSFSIHPNPSNSNEIEIKFEGDEEGLHTLNFYNIQGIKIDSKEWLNAKNSKRDFKFDLKDYQNGVYYVVLKSPWNVISKPMMVVK